MWDAQLLPTPALELEELVFLAKLATTAHLPTFPLFPVEEPVSAYTDLPGAFICRTDQVHASHETGLVPAKWLRPYPGSLPAPPLTMSTLAAIEALQRAPGSPGPPCHPEWGSWERYDRVSSRWPAPSQGWGWVGGVGGVGVAASPVG